MAYELALLASFRIHLVFHVSLLKTVSANHFPWRTAPPPAPVIVDGTEKYEVEPILDCGHQPGQLQYLIKWKGYDVEENSWEPATNIHASGLPWSIHRAHPAVIA